MVAQTDDGTRHIPDPAEADQLMDRALESAERILAPFEAAPIASLFETHYRGAREFLRLSWEGLPEDLVPKSRRPAVVLKAAADLGRRHRPGRTTTPTGWKARAITTSTSRWHIVKKSARSC